MEFRVLRAKKTSFEDEQPFCQSEGQSSISKDFSSCELSGKLSESITHLIVNFYQYSILIEGFFLFLKVSITVLKNVHSSHLANALQMLFKCSYTFNCKFLPK